MKSLASVTEKARNPKVTQRMIRLVEEVKQMNEEI